MQAILLIVAGVLFAAFLVVIGFGVWGFRQFCNFADRKPADKDW